MPREPEPTRRLDWVSAIDPRNVPELARLAERLVDFYTHSPSYYADIDFSAGAWQTDRCYRDIVNRLAPRQQIAEVGCGSANLLRHQPGFIPRYTGCDFSPELMARNRATYPGATFVPIMRPRELPFASGSADAVFSTFVLEHVVYPHEFLLECWRVLRPGGLFIVRCPNFLGASDLSSQRVGLSPGTGGQKLARGRRLDALLTGFDCKVRIPLRCALLRRRIGRGCGFYVNLAPRCFTDPFTPDYDAPYLTYAAEIVSFLAGKIEFPPEAFALNRHWPIYLYGYKRS
jgi:SAM-dependent methyltransferase